MSSNVDNYSMNLHEECLLKYLINPLELYRYTEFLKDKNSTIARELGKNNMKINTAIRNFAN